MGYGAFALLIGVFALCVFVMVDHAAFPNNAIYAATAALGVDLLGFAVAGWKMVLDPATAVALQPVTRGQDVGAPGK